MSRPMAGPVSQGRMQIRIFQGEVSIVEREVNEFLKILSPNSVIDVQLSPGIYQDQVILKVLFRTNAV